MIRDKDKFKRVYFVFNITMTDLKYHTDYS